MCGVDYCETCAPDDFLVAWTEGRHHQVPQFGDAAQKRVARAKRQETYRQVRLNDPAEALKFFDLYDVERERWMRGFLGRMQGNFQRLLDLPDFKAIAEARPCRLPAFAHGTGRGRRKARKRARQAWRMDIIRAYVREHGVVGLKQMLDLCGWSAPWWVNAQIQAEPERLAA